MNVTEWRWAIRDSALPSHAKLVALMLSTRMDSNGGGARPSGQALATDCGISRATVTRALARLRSDGWITVITRPGIGNEYHPRVAQGEPGSQGARLRGSQDVAQGEPRGGSQGATKNNKKINKKNNTTAPPLSGPPPSPNGLSQPRLFVAVADACGWAVKDMTSDSRGRVGKAAKQLLEVGASEQDVRSFALFWRLHYGEDVDLTPQAISGNWAAYKAGNLFSEKRRRR